MAMRFQYAILVSSSHIHSNNFSLALSSSDHGGMMGGARPGVSFLVGTSLVVMSILSVSAVFSCCYHCLKMRSSSSSLSSLPPSSSSSSSSSLPSTILLRLAALTAGGGAGAAAGDMQSITGAAAQIPSSTTHRRYIQDLQHLHLQLRPLPLPPPPSHPRTTSCSPIVEKFAEPVPCPPIVYMPGDQKPTFIAWPCPHPPPSTIIMHPTTHPCAKIG